MERFGCFREEDEGVVELGDEGGEGAGCRGKREKKRREAWTERAVSKEKETREGMRSRRKG